MSSFQLSFVYYTVGSRGSITTLNVINRPLDKSYPGDRSLTSVFFFYQAVQDNCFSKIFLWNPLVQTLKEDLFEFEASWMRNVWLRFQITGGLQPKRRTALPLSVLHFSCQQLRICYIKVIPVTSGHSSKFKQR